MSKNIKLQKSLVLVLKVLIFIIVSYFFYRQISRLTLQQFQSMVVVHPFYFFLTLLLFFMNWGFELLKWKKILIVSQISFSSKNLFSSFFSGITTGIITPNRIGNFIGRMLFFKGKVRAHIILGTLYSNFAQFLVTLIFGIPSFIYLYDIVFNKYGANVFYFALFLLIFASLFYFLVPFIKLNSIKLFKRKFNVLSQFQLLAKQLALPFISLSIGRFLAFSFQYFCFLLAFGVAPTFDLLMAIFMFYLMSTLIPSVFLSKLVVREAAGLFILSFFVDNSAVIVVSSLLLWFVNLGIPSLIGLFYILRKKYLVNA